MINFNKYNAKIENNKYLYIIFNREQYLEDIFIDINNVEIGNGAIRISPPYYFKNVYYYNDELGLYANFNIKAYYFQEGTITKIIPLSSISRILERESLPHDVLKTKDEAIASVFAQREAMKKKSFWAKLFGK